MRHLHVFRYPVFTSLGIMSPDPRFCFIWIWRLLFSKVIAHGRSEEISILIDVVEFFDLVFGFVLIRVEGAYVFDRQKSYFFSEERASSKDFTLPKGSRKMSATSPESTARVFSNVPLLTSR